MKNTTTQKFIISYDGNSLKSHSMSVSDLAPALLALENLIKETNKILSGKDSEAELKVVAHQKGSFEIILNFIQVLPEAMNLIRELDKPDGKEIINTLFGSGGLFFLIKNWNSIEHEDIDKLDKLGNKNQTCKLNGINYKPTVIQLITNYNIEENSKKVLAPLKKNGIESLAFSRERKGLVSIDKKEASFYLNQTRKTENKDINYFTKKYFIIQPHFKDGKWKLSDGSSEILLTIEDSNFIKQVESSSKSFSKGDILNCKIREEQEELKGKLKSSYFLEKVLEHKPACKQTSFDI